MKNLILLISICIVLNGATFAQKVTEDKIPAVVKKEFLKKFPNTSKSKWEMEKDEYEVNFIQNKTEISANFDKNGKLLETEIEITEKELPQIVKSSVEKNFRDYKMHEFSKIEKADKSVLYEVELSKNKEKLDVKFSSNGDLIDKKDISKEKEND
jgi:hypothetical protein